MKIVHVVGARPNFMKIAPIVEAIHNHNLNASTLFPKIHQVLVHTGQHYDNKMSKLFFDELGIPRPDINLEVGSGSHAVQTAEIMKRFEQVCLMEKPSHVLVVGDVNSTIACALVAVKLGIAVIHVEAGLRSFDRSMPEEINRVLTDAISDILFITEESARKNLVREGISEKNIYFVGNVMIDTLLKHREKALRSDIHERMGLVEETGAIKQYAVLTLHRPSSVDHSERLENILEALSSVSMDLPVIFPIHPRTLNNVRRFGLGRYLNMESLNEFSRISVERGISCIEPLGYLDFLCLMSGAQLVLTDSGGIQEETTILGVPCVTIRDNTERPVTLTHGTNILAGTEKDSIIRAAVSQLTMSKEASSDQTGGINNRKPRVLGTPPLWDGRSAERIVNTLRNILK